MHRAVMLIDHDNAPLQQIPIDRVLAAWLATLIPPNEVVGIHEARVRAYGGWWHGEIASNSRHAAVAIYTQECPALVRVNGSYWRVRFEFADYLLYDLPDGRTPRIENTFVLRPSPQLFAPKGGQNPCTEPDCEASRLRKWAFQRKGCTRAACPLAFGDLWYKPEQKQVDTHLLLDLLALSESAAEVQDIALVSENIDFLPGLLVAASRLTPARSLTHIRFSRRTTYLDIELRSRGVQIVTLGGD